MVSALFLSACGDRDVNPAPKSEALTVQTPEQKFASTLKAAEQGDAEAQFNLGLMYDNGNGVAKDFAKATEWWRKAAEKGHAKAQVNIGAIYADGEGVAQDFAKALEWWQKAAQQGNTSALVNMGRMYSNGNGVTKDSTKALELWQKAAEQDDVKAKVYLGRMYALGDGVAQDYTKAFEWWKQAADQGDALAQYNLGWMYSRGDGVAKDLVKTIEWWQKSAEQGVASAQYNLGLMYANGTGVAKDIPKAAEWYRKSAERGNADAQYNLGLMYSLGEGLARDDVLAYAWINLAAAKGDSEIAGFRDVLERYMTKQQLQEAQQLSSQWNKGQSIVRTGSSHLATEAKSTDTATLQKAGTGTTFIVNKAGHAVTNHHVVQGCTELRVEGRNGIAKLVTDDKVNDLALLQIPGQIVATAPIAKDPLKVRQGEEIVVFGFPLNFVLSSGGNLTPGVISALTGLGNNTNQLQITAPIQPGSSGSPVLNQKGEVVGAVVMKLSDNEMSKTTGSIGQNVNFAISGQTLKTFLDTHKVDYHTIGLMSFKKSAADIADEARKWTTVVECWR